MVQVDRNLSYFDIWLLAIRPRTLPVAVGSVAVGVGLAIGDGAFSALPALAALTVAFMLQIASNLANDVFDFKQGKDTEERTGPLRVTQAGLLTPNQVLVGMALSILLAVVAGLYLVWIGGWILLALGFAAIIVAIAYTGGPYPLGYHGWGEVMSFIFFGPVAVCGTYYVQAGSVSPAAWWASLPVGLLTVAILVVNNFRDLPVDSKTGKRTLAVRLGSTATLVEYTLALTVPYLVPWVMWLLGLAPATVLCTWLSLPLILPLLRDMRTKQGSPLNATLADTARLGLIYNFLFAIGYLAGKLL